MSVINTQPLAGASGNQVTGYNLTKSLRFRRSATAYLNRTFTTPTDGKKWTYSVWRKFGDISSTYDILLTSPTANDSMQIVNNVLRWYGGGTVSYDVISSQTWRDPSAWYHFVFVYDSTQATASDRIKYYVNGVRGTFSSASYPTLNLVSVGFNAIGNCQFGADTVNSRYSDGQYAEANFIDGQALTPSSFGENDTITGVWKPKRYTGTYGTNGFYLPFTDVATTSGSNAGLGKDFSGNGNYWNTNNISVTTGATYDSMTDVPTLTSATTANYCVLNPLDKGTNATIDNGNLRVYSSSGWTTNRGTMAFPTTGKYYFEWIFTDNTPAAMVGIATSQAGTSTQLGGDAYGWGYHYSGNKYTNNTATAYGASYTTGDVIGVAFDAGTGALEFYKNNTSQGVAYTGLTTATYFPVSAVAGSSAAQGPTINFGQRGFLYTPPTGYVALNTYNLPDSTIVAGNTNMDVALYTGNSGTSDVTYNFDPAFVWYKNRSRANTNHYFFDKVRGANNAIYSNLTDAENAQFPTYNTQSFITNGSRIVRTNGDHLNYSGDTYVTWGFKGNGAGVSNTSGSITSTVSVNASAGFSIVTYTGNGGVGAGGATVGHGLGVTPSMFFVKNTSNGSTNWNLWHTTFPNGKVMYPNTNLQLNDDTNVWRNTTPTSTVLNVGNVEVNGNGASHVAYCWAEVAGFSKFGSYTGNGSASGPFIYTGFKPAFILVKCTSAVEEWYIGDNKRNLYNESAMGFLRPNTSGTETTTDWYKFYSNGFQMTYPGTDTNGSGRTYIYMAFAENPFKNSLAR